MTASHSEQLSGETATVADVFDMVAMLYVRMERAETMVGHLTNLVLEPYCTDRPPRDLIENSVRELGSYVQDLAEELKVAHEVRQHMTFLNMPE